jgi:hypothetical protein
VHGTHQLIVPVESIGNTTKNDDDLSRRGSGIRRGGEGCLEVPVAGRDGLRIVGYNGIKASLVPSPVLVGSIDAVLHERVALKRTLSELLLCLGRLQSRPDLTGRSQKDPRIQLRDINTHLTRTTGQFPSGTLITGQLGRGTAEVELAEAVVDLTLSALPLNERAKTDDPLVVECVDLARADTHVIEELEKASDQFWG